MRPSTEDLLSVRDGEPVAASARAAIAASPESAAEIERLRAVQRSLEALPELAPPAGVFERIVAAEQQRVVAPRRWSRAVGGFGAAAAVALFALIYAVDQPTENPAIIVRSPSLEAQPAYAELVAESARLERLLAEIPPQSPVVSLGTVSTIVGLEDQIALVDEQLSYGDAIGLQGPQRAVLWTQRVDLMNALVLVRAAHTGGDVFHTVSGETL